VSDQFLDCQGPARHAWFVSDANGYTPAFGVPVVWACERCGTRRLEAWSRTTGEMMSRRYEWPEGYRWGRDERPNADQFRRMWLDTHDPTVTTIRSRRRRA
jgi:hypothetical protein